MSGLKPHRWKSCSRGLRVFLFFHCWTISKLTLYSPLQFGWKTRLRRPSTASGESLICPGLGVSAEPSDKSGISSRGSLPSPVLEGVGVTRLAASPWAPTSLAAPVGEVEEIRPELFDGCGAGYKTCHALLNKFVPLKVCTPHMKNHNVFQNHLMFWVHRVTTHVSDSGNLLHSPRFCFGRIRFLITSIGRIRFPTTRIGSIFKIQLARFERGWWTSNRIIITTSLWLDPARHLVSIHHSNLSGFRRV